MSLLITLLTIFWLYGGAYFASLATASSFYAVFFFFWTRTGDRIGNIDPGTKKVYLHSIYNVLRFSLYMMILSKVVEVAMVTLHGLSLNLSINAMDVILSQNGLFIYMLLVLLLINSIAMQKRAINFAFSLPFAIVSYFFLFIHMTTVMIAGNNRGFFIPAGEVFMIDAVIYLAALILGMIIFNHYSAMVRNNLEVVNKA